MTKSLTIAAKITIGMVKKMSEMYEMNEKERETQNGDVLKCLKTRGYITDDIARDELGVHRLSARIYDLRGRGNKIKTVMKSGKNRYGRTTRFAHYFLEEAV